jgi:hypothetical protein
MKPWRFKDSYPIELAEFAKARGIADESAFAWWVEGMQSFRLEGKGEEEDPQVWD